MYWSIPLKNYSKTPTLISDYLHRKPELKSFIRDFPDKQKLEDFSSIRKSLIPREVLAECIEKQYLEAGLGSPIEVLNKLKNPNSFTVTTGHQLGIATGPLYSIIKILHTIKLAEELNQSNNGINVIPIFWMASEDHDLQEIDHFNLKAQLFSWYTEQDGAVGKMKTNGMEEVWDALEERIGHAKFGSDALRLLRKAYKNGTIAKASRILINELFGDKGLLILDGDDAVLKQYFKPVLQRELFDKCTLNELEKSSVDLRSLKYTPQINAREINMFYLEQNSRKRIIYEGNIFRLIDGNRHWTDIEMRDEIDKYPERFSPNVALRPLYQEMVLPNLAYIGGAGEISYWLQLKGVFDHFEVQFPFLILRNSILLTDDSFYKKSEKFDLIPTDFLRDEQSLIKDFVSAKADVDLQKEVEELKMIFATVVSKLKSVDPTLEATGKAEEKKQMEALQNLEKRMHKSIKSSEEQTISQLSKLRAKLLPGNELMERSDNLFSWYSDYGPELINQMYEVIKPLEAELHVLIPDQPR